MNYNIDNLNKVKKSLINAGLKDFKLELALTQVAHETGDFDSSVFNENNNASGIMYINNSKKQKNATKGKPFPSKEGKYFYANFKSLDDWAKDFIRIVQNSLNKATSINEYASLLKENKYYTDNVSNYLKGLNFNYNKLLKGDYFKVSTKTTAILIVYILVVILIIYKA